ncbi:DsbC family protein [Aliidiomarina halalkaliphila]|uniref:Thiol:disulfide interchange protein n=1 Tax=Aliidiomarina halalkaliphila TaxID=2593535 RepID=A0A552X0P2_9GAMM|nr:DsbC family protein [Aliidiomarina halalkaliphila]TRW48515.1 DsbC family protein [Aliidiomarina halalkaliphila]
MNKLLIPVFAILVAIGIFLSSSNGNDVAEVDTHDHSALVNAIREGNPRFANASVIVHRNLSEFGFNDLYEISLGGQSMVVSSDGQYAFVGDFFELASITNLSQEFRAQRMAEIASEEIPNLPQEMLVSYPANSNVSEVGAIYVFTDPTCGYCRRLHEELDIYAASGVSVHYLPYPRTGLQGGRDFDQLTTIYCADDQQAAMNDFKAGTQGSTYAQVDKTEACQRTVREGYQLGQRIGVTGTPFIVLSNGGVINGYQPAQQIVQRLRQGG